MERSNTPMSLIKAADALIAWNGIDDVGRQDSPPGAIAIGPLLEEDEGDWAGCYENTGGAAHVFRRDMRDMEQKLAVMSDWYMLVYGYGINPYLAHRAFLLIDEYQAVIKQIGLGPDRSELGHDAKS